MLSNKHELFKEELFKNLSNKIELFNEYQNKVLDTLSFFHRVCEKYDIQYYLAYGSLLGAIRDGGQIPWDYDVDVHVPISQPKILIDALNNEIGKDYHYKTRFTDKSFRTYTLKISPTEFDCEVFHVDVFWLFGTDEKNFYHDKIKVASYSRVLQYKFLDKKYLMLSNRKSEKIAYSIYKFLSKFYSTYVLDHYFLNLFSRNTSTYSYLTDNANEVFYPKEWFKNRTLVKLDKGMEFYIPTEYDKVLHKTFGSYMETLSIDERMKEFMSSIIRLEKLARL